MKKAGTIIYTVFMAIVAIVCFNKFFNMEVINTNQIIQGTNELTNIRSIIMVGYLLAIICLPILLAFMMDKIWWPIIYGMVIVVGAIMGESQFFIYFMGLSSIPGVICGAIADVISLILKLFISDYSGTWLTVIGQVIGHLSTIAILMVPELLIEDIIEGGKKTENKSDRNSTDSLTSSVLNHDFYGEAKREYHQQEQLETLRRIARDLENR